MSTNIISRTDTEDTARQIPGLDQTGHARASSEEEAAGVQDSGDTVKPGVFRRVSSTCMSIQIQVSRDLRKL